jgi:carbohydrate kinase (thermoresistant glucokinase family)
MGVSGSGKSTIGAALAERLGLPFVDGDALHPMTNLERMASGLPLRDDDRWPWLAAVGARLAEGDVVVACSALKRSYRDAILAGAPDARFIHLTGTHELLDERMQRRTDHFMPASLLESQLATLEPLAEDEAGVTVENAGTVDAVVAGIIDALGSKT